jgi:hypothetical protein
MGVAVTWGVKVAGLAPKGSKSEPVDFTGAFIVADV